MTLTNQSHSKGSSAESDVAPVVTQLREVYAGDRTRKADWRKGQIGGIERFLDEREQEIAAALAADLGRSEMEAWLADVALVKAEATYARKRLRWWMRRRPQPLPLNQLPAVGWVQYEPRGVVLVIGAWNYPVYLTLVPLVAALAAGNVVIVKPSEGAPATSALLAHWLPRYVDPEAVVVVEGDAQVTQELLSQGPDKVLFTGGTEIGRKILARAAPDLTPVLLELGGKSPVVVAADAEMDVVARRVAWAKLFNSGQTCLAPDYVLAERSIHEQLVHRIIDTLTQFRADQQGQGLQIVNERQFDRLAASLADTSGRIVFGGGSDRDALTIEPTVIIDPDPDDAVMQEEIFGPILPVLAVDSIDEAITFVNARPKPLAAYYFTSSRTVATKLVNAISSGGAVVNHVTVHAMVPQLPFGGVGDSGMGAYHGKWGFEAFSHRKSVLVKPFKPDLKFVYPPYSARSVKIMRRVF
ncbi:MAG: aldehyde dehydrogenase family protein [Rhodococcus sp. (in: high G+C Gram-positive bacteria)]|uniref:aldehyde dehydrogenase family protein n=1 Tax=Rhodococcus sp. TaxID=1831 RepID=UPI0011F68FA7|nr:aldehyde dehydrogenase family protein [Rhodococcus sp. (in: high G+C Gram-positive bacteria)]RZL25401.1 MAG: aldehyde dehydrogenase family protein [Rhodococcus sp. (in: high G+C Gram-positive bacteria)]